VTLGSCDSSKIARPGHHLVSRFGLLLGLLGASVGAATGCVDQPLIPVAGNPVVSGGTTSQSPAEGAGPAHGGGDRGSYGAGGKADATGGWLGAGGGWQSGGSSQSVGCVATFGEYCASSRECCDGTLCRGGVCQSCVRVNDTCAETAECCSGICTKHRCQDISTSCYVQGSTCTNDDGCCSHQCWPASSLGAANVCVPLDGCQPMGESCFNDTACCSGFCSFLGTGSGRCSAEQPCLGSGDLCADASKDRGCCSPTTTFCGAYSSTSGIKRCTSLQCKGPNDTCSHAAECCNSTGLSPNPKRCLFVNGDYSTRRCVDCRPERSSCTLGSDCCEGLTCDLYSSNPSYKCVSMDGTGGTSSGTTQPDTCIALNQSCAPTSFGVGGSSNSTTALPCCGSAVCDASSYVPKCVQH
jgi:hypothetical protein